MRTNELKNTDHCRISSIGVLWSKNTGAKLFVIVSVHVLLMAAVVLTLTNTALIDSVVNLGNIMSGLIVDTTIAAKTAIVSALKTIWSVIKVIAIIIIVGFMIPDGTTHTVYCYGHGVGGSHYYYYYK